MGKTRDLFKKIRDIKGTFHAKMGSIKDRNGMDLTEAEDIKRWQEYTHVPSPRLPHSEPSFWVLQASLQKAQGPGVCKLPKPPASRALCQAKRAPSAALHSGCLAEVFSQSAETVLGSSR